MKWARRNKNEYSSWHPGLKVFQENGTPESRKFIQQYLLGKYTQREISELAFIASQAANRCINNMIASAQDEKN